VIIPDPQKIAALGLDPNAVSQELALLNYGYPLPVSGPGVMLPVPTVLLKATSLVSLSRLLLIRPKMKMLWLIFVFGGAPPPSRPNR